MSSKNPFGQWTVYRRKEDLALWLVFQNLARRRGLSQSAALGEAAQLWVDAQPGDLPELPADPFSVQDDKR